MSYHLDFSQLDLDFLKRRLSEEDLIPSHLSVREQLDEKLLRFQSMGIHTIADLTAQLKHAAAIKKLSETSGIDQNYLKLLGRILGGYQPKIVRLSEYPNSNPRCITVLEAYGLVESRSFWNQAHLKEERALLATMLHVPFEELSVLACLCDLSRIQWVSPLFARLLLEGGYESVARVSAADSSELVQAIADANARLLLFKGKIGQKDMARLVYCANLLSQELEF